MQQAGSLGAGMVGAREGQKRDRERRLSTNIEDGAKDWMDVPCTGRHSQRFAFRKGKMDREKEKKQWSLRMFVLGRCALSLTKVDQLVQSCVLALGKDYRDNYLKKNKSE